MGDKKKLTLFEAASTVAGLGVGGAIMAVPFLASRNGLATIIFIMVVSYLISLLLHLMIVEVVLRDEEPRQLVEVFGKYLFMKGPVGTTVTWLFFGLIVVTFYALLAGYIVGCAEILLGLLGIPILFGKILTYAVAAGVAFFGLKAVGLCEKYAISGIIALLIVLSVGTLIQPLKPIPVFAGDVKKALAFYGMLMFGFACFFSIPQAAEGLYWNRKLVPWAVVIGIALNMAFTFIITIMALLVSKEVTEVAITGWGAAIGNWALIVGSVFILLAILTSYWSVSYALALILQERLGWGYRKSWLSATFPSIVIALIGVTGFLGFMKIAGGAMAVLVAILIVPALRKSRVQAAAQAPVFEMGFWGNTFFQIVVIVAYLIMAVGSVIPVK